jgi:archaeosine-15-forming tRNA-guanine transglycosylase
VEAEKKEVAYQFGSEKGQLIEQKAFQFKIPTKVQQVFQVGEGPMVTIKVKADVTYTVKCGKTTTVKQIIEAMKTNGGLIGVYVDQCHLQTSTGKIIQLA